MKQELREQGLLVAGVDLQTRGPSTADGYPDFLAWVADHLARDLETQDFERPVGQDAEELATWLERLLPEGEQAIVICVDEAANVPQSMLHSFYGQLRGIFNTVAEKPDSPLCRLRFVFAGMFHPDKLVSPNNSPFNICVRVNTDDLGLDQARELARSVLGKEELDESEDTLIRRAYQEVGGQPFLLQQLLSLAFDADPLDRGGVLEEAIKELPFSEHVFALMRRVLEDEATQSIATELAQFGEIDFLPDADYQYLCAIGLAGRGEAKLTFRNELYARVARSSPQLHKADNSDVSTSPLWPLPEARFAFMHDKDYKDFAHSAQRGAAYAYNSRSYRLALIGFGSALEAVFVDWLRSLSKNNLNVTIAAAEKAGGPGIWNKGEKAKGPTGWRLVNLVNVASQVGALQGASEMSDQLRQFRNWVHPKPAIASGFTEEDLGPEAKQACGTFEAIVRDVRRATSSRT
jgi:hypothetical protein